MAKKKKVKPKTKKKRKPAKKGKAVKKEAPRFPITPAEYIEDFELQTNHETLDADFDYDAEGYY